MATKRQFRYRGDRVVRDAATVVFMVLITVLGAAMMTLTSSPLVKGAAFLWLPAALQLIAGVWLGPVRGLLAGGIGAYAAGIVAYGGWGPPDIIMNLVAGGLANSLLPGALFKLFRIDPTFGATADGFGKSLLTVLLLTVVVITLALIQLPLMAALRIDLGAWGYVIPIGALLLVPIVGTLRVRVSGFVAGALIAIFCCFVSAAIGVWGAVVGGQSLRAAILGTGIGWFLGDTASSILGLYILAQFTQAARQRGIAPELVPSVS